MLTDELPGLVSSLSFKKSMRWNPGGAGSGSVAFSRPMRWLLALHGDTVLPFVHGALQVGHARGASALYNVGTSWYGYLAIPSPGSA